jgi:hypothetical protein
MALLDALAGLEPLCRHLVANGYKAKLVPGDKDRAVLPLLGPDSHGIAITGRGVRLITIRIAGGMWGFDSPGRTSFRVGPIPVYESRELPIQVHYVVPVDPTGSPWDFEVELKTKRKGFLWLGDVVEASWKGGKLGEALGKNPERTLKLANGLKPRESLRIKPDTEGRCVRLVHQTKMALQFSLLSAEMLQAERRFPPPALLEGIEWLAKEIASLQPKKRRTRAKAPKR